MPGGYSPDPKVVKGQQKFVDGVFQQIVRPCRCRVEIVSHQVHRLVGLNDIRVQEVREVASDTVCCDLVRRLVWGESGRGSCLVAAVVSELSRQFAL